jgi:GTP pyrophosphokinase
MEKDYQKEFDEIFGELKAKIVQYSPKANLELLNKVYGFSSNAHHNQLRKSGRPYFEHCLEVARILVDLRLDTATIASGLLHDVVEDTGVSLNEVKAEFGEEIASLVDGVTMISGLKSVSLEEKQAENYRKMLLSVAKDIRVILIKLADRLHNMRTLEFLSEKKQKEISTETLNVYAPIAHRLGIRKLKWELEDLSLKFLNRDLYRELAIRVNDKRALREKYIHEISEPINKALASADITARIEGRPKSLYSIYNKFINRGVDYGKMYDLYGIRIIVERIEECYKVLGIVHSMFKPFSDKFRDYIGVPRANGYQSLHTAIYGPEEKIVEIQIRTEQMHRVAEEGVAAHWRYKNSDTDNVQLDQYYKWLRQVVESIQEAQDDPKEVLERIKINLLQEEVFVFTPQGRLIQLPTDSTPVDFAFAVHTDIGYHCIGAKVNGRIVPLNHKLKSGDAVEIITSANQKPNSDWMRFVRTSKARSKIKRWVKESMVEQSQKLGEEILQRAFKRLHLKKTSEEMAEIARTFGLNDEQQLQSAVGRGDISAESVVRKIVPEPQAPPESAGILQKFLNKARGAAKGVRVQGLDHLLITFGKCCQPVPGDRITGFLTHGRGVVVHRTDCKNMLPFVQNPERVIEVNWDVEPDKHFMVCLHLLGEDRKHFLRDVSEAISHTDTNIVRIEMRGENSLVHSNIIVEVKNLHHLTQVIGKIGKVSGVFSVERMDNATEPVTEAEV